MQMPLQITFRDLDRSAAVEARIRSKVDKLDTVYNKIISCHVVVEQVQKHNHKGRLNNITIRVTVPGKEFAVTHQPNENLYLAIQGAIDSLRDQLEEYRSKLYRDVKDHGERLHGVIEKLMPDEGYGFIADAENNEYYFNLTHLVDVKFHQLQIGDKVRFLPAEGNEGLQARRISVPKKNRKLH